MGKDALRTPLTAGFKSSPTFVALVSYSSGEMREYTNVG